MGVLDGGVYSILEKAHKSRRTVEITYYSYGRGEFTNRKIDVYFLSRRYIQAYDYLSKEVRKFGTSRITEAKVTQEAYTIPEEYREEHKQKRRRTQRP
jgi:predicted DNA-binding transcriptional regulator YafY